MPALESLPLLGSAPGGIQIKHQVYRGTWSVHRTHATYLLCAWHIARHRQEWRHPALAAGGPAGRPFAGSCRGRARPRRELRKGASGARGGRRRPRAWAPAETRGARVRVAGGRAPAAPGGRPAWGLRGRGRRRAPFAARPRSAAAAFPSRAPVPQRHAAPQAPRASHPPRGGAPSGSRGRCDAATSPGSSAAQEARVCETRRGRPPRAPGGKRSQGLPGRSAGESAVRRF